MLEVKDEVKFKFDIRGVLCTYVIQEIEGEKCLLKQKRGFLDSYDGTWVLLSELTKI